MLAGLLINYGIKKPRLRTLFYKSVKALWIVSGLVWLTSIIYFQTWVEPTLNGTEGTGVGFGQALSYIGLGVVFLFFSGLTIVSREVSNKQR